MSLRQTLYDGMSLKLDGSQGKRSGPPIIHEDGRVLDDQLQGSNMLKQSHVVISCPAQLK